MRNDKAACIRRLGSIDRLLRAHVSVPLSLAPTRREITTLAHLAETLLPEGKSAAFCNTLATGLATVVEAEIRHFPDNIFWDFDSLLGFLCSQSEAALVGVICHKIAHLLQCFGVHSSIRFQYAHDFTYGFDWARWVAKAPAERAHCPPYGVEFLAYLEKRETELLQLIAADDAKYHKLRSSAPRNPFLFSRTPELEKKLHEELARRDLVPLPAWQPQTFGVWEHDYTRLREGLCAGLSKAAGSAAKA